MGCHLFTEKDLAGMIFASHGDSVMVDKSRAAGYAKPTDAYMIYFGKDPTTGDYIIRHVAAPVNSVSCHIDDHLFDIAKNNRRGVFDNGLDDTIVFRKPSYLTLVLDIPRYDWVFDAARKLEPVTFKNQKGTKAYDNNFSFYDAKRAVVKNCPAIRLTNYFKKDAKGTPIGKRENKLYYMEFNIMVPVQGARPNPVGFDPDTQNQGPDTVP